MYLILISPTYFVKIFSVNCSLSSFYLKFYPRFSKNAQKKEVPFLKPLFDTIPSQFYIWLTNVSITFSAAPNAAAATL
mgnify:CR=1 FL=1